MNKRHIETREQALLVLRQAREWVKAGIIRNGRTNVTDMALDAVEDAPHDFGRTASPKLPVKHDVAQRALAYLCLALGPVDPGTSSGRDKKLAKWACCQYVTQNTIIWLYERAVVTAVADIRELKKKLKKN